MAARPYNRRSQLRRVFRAVAVRRVFVTMLALLISNAPWPCVHEHEITGETVTHSVSMAHHVDRHHADAFQSGLAKLGWHWHLVLPWQACDESNPDQPDEPVPSLPASPTVELSHANLQIAPVNLIDTGIHAVRAIEMPLHAQTSASQFFATYGCSVAIGDLVSVRLC